MISLGSADLMANTRKIDKYRPNSAIYLIRGQRVMLDSDLAASYQVTTSRLNEQLRRNLKRFPEDFVFQLTRDEFARLISQIAISKKRLLEAEARPKRAIGFHVREPAARYQAKKRF